MQVRLVSVVKAADEPESFTKDNSGHDSVYSKGRGKRISSNQGLLVQFF